MRLMSSVKKILRASFPLREGGISRIIRRLRADFPRGFRDTVKGQAFPARLWGRVGPDPDCSFFC